MLALLGILVTGLLMNGKLATDVAQFAAVGVGISLAMSAFMDLKSGFKNLIRADLMAILAFYFLTLFEFLFPQENFDTMIGPRLTHESLIVVLVGFAGLFVVDICSSRAPSHSPPRSPGTCPPHGSSSSSGSASASATSTCFSR
jgi:hypothetical protein